MTNQRNIYLLAKAHGYRLMSKGHTTAAKGFQVQIRQLRIIADVLIMVCQDQYGIVRVPESIQRFTNQSVVSGNTTPRTECTALKREDQNSG